MQYVLSFFQFYERSERPTRSERTYDPTQLNSNQLPVELSRIGRSESRFKHLFNYNVKNTDSYIFWPLGI